MSEKTKIALSAKELQLVCDKEWILTKQNIIEKVYRLFGTLSLSMQQQMMKENEKLPKEAAKNSPKISKGENYMRLPFVMLDYPRYFTKESILAIRIFFWWGNFFSINLHLTGAAKAAAIPSLKANFIILQQLDYSICINTDPWQHHFEANNFMPLKNLSEIEFATMLNRGAFLKIAKKIPLQEWDEAPLFLDYHFSKMLRLLEINYQGGETDPLPGIPIAGFDL